LLRQGGHPIKSGETRGEDVLLKKKAIMDQDAKSFRKTTKKKKKKKKKKTKLWGGLRAQGERNESTLLLCAKGPPEGAMPHINGEERREKRGGHRRAGTEGGTLFLSRVVRKRIPPGGGGITHFPRWRK